VQNAATPRKKLRWPPPSLLLLLQLLVVILGALALAQPLLGTDRVDGGHRVYVLDASASMRATDIAPSRFGAALAWLTQQIDADTGEGGGRISIVTASADPRVEVARQAASPGLLPIVDGLDATDGPADWETASALIAQPSAATRPRRSSSHRCRSRPPVVGSLCRGRASGFRHDDVVNVGLTATIAAIDARPVNGRSPGSCGSPARVLADRGERSFPPEAQGFVDWAETEVTRQTAPAEAHRPREIVEASFEIDLTCPAPVRFWSNSPTTPDRTTMRCISWSAAADRAGPLYRRADPAADRGASGDRPFGAHRRRRTARRPALRPRGRNGARSAMAVDQRCGWGVRIVGDEEPASWLVANGITGWDDEHPLSQQVD
jgi:hypothetical protein